MKEYQEQRQKYFDMSNSTKLKVCVVVHYWETDINCSHDYTSIDIVIGGVVVADYGDAYHDKVRDKVAGFIDALRIVYGDIEVEFLNVPECA